MTSSWLRRRWLWVLTAAILVASGGAATVWNTHDGATPLEKDCAAVEDLGRQSQELTTWMNTGLDDGTLDDPGEIVERESTLGDKLRAAAGSVTTPEMKKPLATWADAMGLNAQLQREANKMSAEGYPPREWVANVHKYNTMTDEALDALNQQCPGLKQVVRGS